MWRCVYTFTYTTQQHFWNGVLYLKTAVSGIIFTISCKRKVQTQHEELFHFKWRCLCLCKGPHLCATQYLKPPWIHWPQCTVTTFLHSISCCPCLPLCLPLPLPLLSPPPALCNQLARALTGRPLSALLPTCVFTLYCTACLTVSHSSPASLSSAVTATVCDGHDL